MTFKRTKENTCLSPTLPQNGGGLCTALTLFRIRVRQSSFLNSLMIYFQKVQVSESPWQFIFAKAWTVTRHKNFREDHTTLPGLRWRPRQNKTNFRRTTVITDSQVIYYSITDRRSSSPGLQRLAQKNVAFFSPVPSELPLPGLPQNKIRNIDSLLKIFCVSVLKRSTLLMTLKTLKTPWRIISTTFFIWMIGYNINVSQWKQNRRWNSSPMKCQLNCSCSVKHYAPKIDAHPSSNMHHIYRS